MIATLLLAGLAGILSILSPCVLPLVPIVLATAASRHRLGPLALALGLALSFVAVGLFVALVGFALGFDLGFFRALGAMIMIGLGAVLMLPALQARLALAAGPMGAFGQRRFGAIDDSGWQGQFGIGLLLGLVWSPCVGPTLGAASLMAARGENLGEVALTMLAFGIGAALPLLLFGALSREAFNRWRAQMLGLGHGIKIALGSLLVLIGLMILSGTDKRVEAALVAATPAWLTELTTRY